jgi:thioredoxin reductase (NADPH)
VANDRAPVAIVGAGPTGIACAAELARRGIEAVCYDKGCFLDSLYKFSEEMVWFSTRELLAIAGIPFPGPTPHPTRLETLAYYREVARAYSVRIEPWTEVCKIVRENGSLRICLSGREGERETSARAAIIATGFFHNPRHLNIPGSDLPHVLNRYVSGHPFFGRNVIVIGSKNSAAEAALDLFRHGARVTIVARGAAISERVKYWLRPDLENRIAAGEIAALFRSRLVVVTPAGARVETPAGIIELRADAIFSMIGYEPDFAFLEVCGVTLEGSDRIPTHNPATLESNVPGLYLAGSVLTGRNTGQIFIENSRGHAGRIAEAIGLGG